MEGGSVFGGSPDQRSYLGTGQKYGIDRGVTKYPQGGESHNGVKVFEPHEEKIIDDIFTKDEWIKMIPETVEEVLYLFKIEYLNLDETCDLLELDKNSMK